MEELGGDGQACDATISFDDVEEYLDLVAEAEQAVETAKTKRVLAKRDLEGAEAAVVEAEAELARLQGV